MFLLTCVNGDWRVGVPGKGWPNLGVCVSVEDGNPDVDVDGWPDDWRVGVPGEG